MLRCNFWVHTTAGHTSLNMVLHRLDRTPQECSCHQLPQCPPPAGRTQLRQIWLMQADHAAPKRSSTRELLLQPSEDHQSTHHLLPCSSTRWQLRRVLKCLLRHHPQEDASAKVTCPTTQGFHPTLRQAIQRHEAMPHPYSSTCLPCGLTQQPCSVAFVDGGMIGRQSWRDLLHRTPVVAVCAR